MFYELESTGSTCTLSSANILLNILKGKIQDKNAIKISIPNISTSCFCDNNFDLTLEWVVWDQYTYNYHRLQRFGQP